MKHHTKFCKWIHGVFVLFDHAFGTNLKATCIVFLYYSDGNLIKFHKEKGGIVTIASHKRQVHIDFGVLNVDTEDVLQSYDEKPTLDYLVSMGVYVLNPEVLLHIPEKQRIDFPDIVKKFLDQGEKVQTYITEEYWLDIGRHDDYAKASETFEKMKNKSNLDFLY